MVVVNLALATICFLNSCYPALVGLDTPKGEFQMVQVITNQKGYGGDVLEFKETPASNYAIHRVWLLRPEEHRLERLQSNDPADRTTITHGCINLMPDVYEKLRDCCSTDMLKIE